MSYIKKAAYCILFAGLFCSAPVLAQEAPEQAEADPLHESGIEEQEAALASESQVEQQSIPIEPIATTQEAEVSSLEQDILILSHSGEPLPNAELTLLSSGERYKADKAGVVRLELEDGEHKVELRAKGHETSTELISVDVDTRFAGVEISMDYALEEVVVTGTRTEKLLANAPVKTQLISKQKMERMQANTLADALSQSSGVRVENNCQNCNFTQVRLNGLEGRYTQILIDGKPSFSSLAGVYGLEQIPAEMIERIEIIKGGGSALYGGNAVAGVINVITERPKKSFAEINAMYQLVGLDKSAYNVGADAGVVNDDRSFAGHVFANVSGREPWDANKDGFSELGQLREVSGGGEIYVDLLKDMTLELAFHGLQEKRRGGDRLNTPEHEADVAEATTARRIGAGLRFKHLINEHFNYALSYDLAYTERDSFYGTGGRRGWPDLQGIPDPPNRDDYQSDAEYEAAKVAYEAKMQESIQNNPGFADWTYEDWQGKMTALGSYGRTKNWVHFADATANIAYEALGEQIITTGAQFQFESLYDYFPAYEDRKIDDQHWNFGFFVQHNWQFASWGESLLGLRLDKHSELSKPVVSPRVALRFNPIHWLRLRSSFSSGFRAPHIFDEDLHVTVVGGEGTIIKNDPNLKPEYSYSVAQQVEGHWDVDDWHFIASLNAYWTRIQDAFSTQSAEIQDIPGTHKVIRLNRGNTTVAGAELEFGVQYRDLWGLDLGWTYDYSQNSDADGDFEGDPNDKRIFRTPETYGYAATWVKLFDALQIVTDVKVTGPMYVPHFAGMEEQTLKKSPWFADWSFSIEYTHKFSHDRYIGLIAGFKNILDSRQRDYDIGKDRDAGYVYGPMSPRSFFVSFKGGI
ncbi:MAG: TonB-dependent receptor [Bradymonadales bacterium]|jgi:outer membrane receptor for ferrienterochelin and colicins